MAVVEKNWQTTRPTIKERSKFMFNKDLFSDVKFVVRKTDGESESKQVIPAHKFMLSISSPVFEAMFYGELAETRDSIELPDCEYESLLELFRYMYSDEVILSGSNVMGVRYLAKKYEVPSLADKCTEYLDEHYLVLDPSNVFRVLPFVDKYEKEILDRCWKVIDEQTEEAVKSVPFATIDRSLLEAVVKRDTLKIKEIELFKAVDLWTTKECERQGLAADSAVKRRILGEEIVKEIHFPTMKQEDFESVVLESGILTPKEIARIVKFLNSNPMSVPVGFPETKRGGCQRCCRFGSSSPMFGWNYYGGIDAINLSVNKDIVLHGVCFFGNLNLNLSLYNPYSVALQVNKTNSLLVLGQSEQFSSGPLPYSSELLQCGKGSYYGFKVLFDTKIILQKHTMYCISANISGPPSFSGINGFSSVESSDVTFTFFNAGYCTNGTDVTRGQFPELLFSLK